MKVRKVVKESGVKVLFIATDHDPMLNDLKAHLSDLKVGLFFVLMISKVEYVLQFFIFFTNTISLLWIPPLLSLRKNLLCNYLDLKIMTKNYFPT